MQQRDEIARLNALLEQQRQDYDEALRRQRAIFEENLEQQRVEFERRIAALQNGHQQNGHNGIYTFFKFRHLFFKIVHFLIISYSISGN